MCPACMTAAAWWVAGGASGGGIAAWCLYKTRLFSSRLSAKFLIKPLDECLNKPLDKKKSRHLYARFFSSNKRSRENAASS